MEETAGLTGLLHNLTRVDDILYGYARCLFDQRHRTSGLSYDAATFELNHASGLLRELRGFEHSGATRYSVRDPIVGSGFHGRDGSQHTDCAVWTGPEPATTIYMPVPACTNISLLVWIRGFVTADQRQHLCVTVNNEPLSHRFEPADGYADLLVVDFESTRDFARLDIQLDATHSSGEPGSVWHDPRKRGLAFDSYGWRIR